MNCREKYREERGQKEKDKKKEEVIKEDKE
jgi:hypothetical protein